MESKEKAKKIASLLDNKLASNIVVLDMEGVSPLADYFILATGKSTRQNKALQGYVEEDMTKEGMEPLQIEGHTSGDWILLDYGDVIIHLFTEEQRSYYDLERLWKDAIKIELS
ncbi:ribosome silencing factor [Clostridia bacterium]|nr:ribosome silencing factor [Clostridia bacterium]